QGVLDIGDPIDDRPNEVMVRAGRFLLPVAANSTAQALRLADVQHRAPGVLHEVDAGLVGQLREGRLELRGHDPMLGRGAETTRQPQRRGTRTKETRPDTPVVRPRLLGGKSDKCGAVLGPHENSTSSNLKVLLATERFAN